MSSAQGNALKPLVIKMVMVRVVYSCVQVNIFSLRRHTAAAYRDCENREFSNVQSIQNKPALVAEWLAHSAAMCSRA